MKTIVNIINFVRAVEPRAGRDIDLLETLKNETAIMRKLGLCGTLLLQYDTMMDEDFVEHVASCLDFCEVGLWLELVQAHVEAAGGEWRGRYSWDWHNDVGFLIGYQPEFRKKLIDVAMEKYKSLYGKYPTSVGSWHIDAISMRYLAEKYNIQACCICRDQVGTDGYTIEGGYYNQAYYPSVNNMFCPAGSAETQINMPVFRMLGTDPVLTYEFKENSGRIPTLEPAQTGKYAPWCDWFFKELTAERGISFQYTQAGQENSFGWQSMKDGYEYQMPLIKKLADEGKVEIMTLTESGKWYKENFKVTPPASYVGLSEWQGSDQKSVWYYSRFYRASVKWDDGIVRFRDIYVFDDRFKEYYYDNICTSNACEFRNLPVIDGKIYAAPDTHAGIFFDDKNGHIHFDSLAYSENDSQAFVTLVAGDKTVKLTFSETAVKIQSNIPDLILRASLDTDRLYGNYDSADSDYANSNCPRIDITYVSSIEVADNQAKLTFGAFEYAVKATKGILTDFFTLITENGSAELTFPHLAQ